MGQIDNMPIAFAMKQCHLTTVEQAITIILKLEMFLAPRQHIAQLEEAPMAQVIMKQQ